MPKPKSGAAVRSGDTLNLLNLENRIDEARDELRLLGSLLDYAARDGHGSGAGPGDWRFGPSDVGALSAALIRIADDLDTLHDAVTDADTAVRR